MDTGRRADHRLLSLGRSWAALLMFAMAALLLFAAAVWARQEWLLPHTQAVVAECRQVTRPASRWYAGRKIVDDCRVVWPSADGPRSSRLDLPMGRYRTGDTVSVVVQHDNATVPPPPQAMIYFSLLALLAVTFGRWLLPPHAHRRTGRWHSNETVFQPPPQRPRDLPQTKFLSRHRPGRKSD